MHGKFLFVKIWASFMMMLVFAGIIAMIREVVITPEEDKIMMIISMVCAGMIFLPILIGLFSLFNMDKKYLKKIENNQFVYQYNVISQVRDHYNNGRWKKKYYVEPNHELMDPIGVFPNGLVVGANVVIVRFLDDNKNLNGHTFMVSAL